MVDVVTLRKILANINYPHVDYLKIDTEGHDLFVLKGFPWENIRPDIIECEFEDFKTVPLGYTFKTLAEFLTNLHYHVYVSEWYPIHKYGIRHDWRCLQKYPANLLDPKSWGNLIAFHQTPDQNKIVNILEDQLLTSHN